MQYPCSSRAQILTHGDRGSNSAIVEVLGLIPYSSSLFTPGSIILNTLPVSVPRDLPQQIDRALEEDIGSGDVTAALIPPGAAARASVIARESAILCGIPYVDATFARIDPTVRIEWRISEGAAAAANQILFTMAGPA